MLGGSDVEIVVEHTECVEQGGIAVEIAVAVGKIVVGSGSHHD